jgi:hypothetical protein
LLAIHRRQQRRRPHHHLQKAESTENRQRAGGQAVGERNKTGDELIGVVANLEEKKKADKKGAPIVVHHFPIHSRPGLL